MHVQVVEVICFRLDIGLSGKPCNALFVDVDPERTDAVDQNVDSQVILQIVDQMRFVEILLDYVASFFRAVVDDPFAVSAQVDSLALGKSLWLDDVGHLLALFFGPLELSPEIS